MLAVVEGKNEEDYDAIKYRELVQEYAKKLEFFNNVPECKAVDYITIGDRRYKFCFELTEITAGQYIDINHFSGQIMQLHKIGACFFLPMKGDKYMEYGTIENITMTAAYNLPIIQYLNSLAYLKDYNKHKEAEYKQWELRHRKK